MHEFVYRVCTTFYFVRLQVPVSVIPEQMIGL